MAKKSSVSDKKKKNTPIDRVAKHSQQPRSSPPKRRSDFSFFTSPSSLYNLPTDSSPGSSSGDVRLSNATTSSSLEMRMTVKQIANDALVRCINYPEGRPTCASESSDLPVAELDSAVRDIGGDRDTCIKMSESTPHDSSVSDCSSLAVSPGSASFEERSNNPSNDFQEALKQALQRKSQLGSCQNLSPDRSASAHSNQQECSSGKYSSPSSSRTINDLQERRRGKRERKPKVHFDEVTIQMKSDRSTRRLKIMRHLGLAPPVGSPFCP